MKGRAAPGPGNARDLSQGCVPHGAPKAMRLDSQTSALMLARTCQKVVLGCHGKKPAVLGGSGGLTTVECSTGGHCTADSCRSELFHRFEPAIDTRT